eukprot:5953520-Prymnesium_polylepis.1
MHILGPRATDRTHTGLSFVSAGATHGHARRAVHRERTADPLPSHTRPQWTGSPMPRPTHAQRSIRIDGAAPGTETTGNVQNNGPTTYSSHRGPQILSDPIRSYRILSDPIGSYRILSDPIGEHAQRRIDDARVVQRRRAALATVGGKRLAHLGRTHRAVRTRRRAHALARVVD